MSEELLRRRAAEEGWFDALLFDVGLAVVLFVVVMGLIALPIYVSKRMRGDIRWLRRSSRRGRLVQEPVPFAADAKLRPVLVELGRWLVAPVE